MSAAEIATVVLDGEDIEQAVTHPASAPHAHVPRAIRAFYGASERLAARPETVKALIGTPDRDRPQEVYTPEVIRDFLVELWGAIRLDPCSGPDSILGAERVYCGRQIETGRKSKDGRAILEWTGPGLTSPWTDCTYFNPPYAQLEAWLSKAVAEHEESGFEIAGLVPVRPNRVWWRDTILKRADVIGWCNPVTFRGYDSSFPQALVMPYWGPRPAQFAYLFEKAGLGEAEVRVHGAP